MKRLILSFSLFSSSIAIGATSEPVAPVKLRNNAETNTLDIDALSRASVKIQGGSDNTTIGNTGDRLKIEGIIVATNVVDATNSTTTPLAASGTYSGTSFDALTYSSITTTIFSSTTGVLSYQFSSDGVNFDTSEDYNIIAGRGNRITVDISARYYRVRFVNSATVQTALRLQTVLHPFHRQSTEAKELFEPESIRNRNYVTANVAQASSSGTVYTVTPGKTLHMTGGIVSMINTSLLSLGTGRLDIRDGSSAVLIPFVVPGGSAPINISFTLPTGLRFKSSVTATVIFGSITYSVFFTGYEADE